LVVVNDVQAGSGQHIYTYTPRVWRDVEAVAGALWLLAKVKAGVHLILGQGVGDVWWLHVLLLEDVKNDAGTCRVGVKERLCVVVVGGESGGGVSALGTAHICRSWAGRW